MRVESSVTSVSWIPLGAVEAMPKLMFGAGVTHYDLPPPDELHDAQGLIDRDGARFVNKLHAFLEVEDGRISGYGHLGGGLIGNTTLRPGLGEVTFPGVAFPDLRPEPQVGGDWVRFQQTAGGRTGLPMPRRVRRKPFLQITAASAWTTLSLTIHTDGRSEHAVVGASSFPRHWIYDHTGQLAAKTGVIDFKTWSGESFGEHTPWGHEESPALVAAAESALERELSAIIIGSKPPFRHLAPGERLVEQGQSGDELFLLFDGMLVVIRDGQLITEVGPGAILGEMALLEGGRRTATLRAVTRCRVAVVPNDRVDRAVLDELAKRRQAKAAE